MEAVKTLTSFARGLVFLSFAEWLRLEEQGNTIETLRDALPAETFELLSSADKSKKYPIARLADLFDCSRDKLGFDARHWEDFGSHLCRVSLHTRFGGLASYLDPETFMTRVPLFWSRYFEGSNMDMDEVTANSALLRLREPLGFEELMPLFSGWLSQALRMMDADGIEVEARDYSWHLTWNWDEG